MIAARRGPHPQSLRGDQSPGAKERQDAIDHYADPAKREKSFDFKVYKEPDVVAGLQAMFGHKCAYCESDYGPVAPADVEHYRPKGAVMGPDGKIRKPGYYWLAAQWSNLLPSCIDCNRARGHEYEDGPEVTGKANAFPLVDETKRAGAPDEEAGEEALLLDPTRDQPDEHLEFIDGGLVRASSRDGGESERGKSTIAVVGLRRPELVRTRRDRLLWIDDAIESFRRAAEQLALHPTDSFAKSVLEDATKALKKYMEPSSAYAGMARQRIEPVLDELGIPMPQ